MLTENKKPLLRSPIQFGTPGLDAVALGSMAAAAPEVFARKMQDLIDSGELRWEVPLGFIPDLAAHPQAAEWGSPNLGGAIVTAGGLVFVAGSMDNHLRAFDIETGKELWRGDLPAGGHFL